jgi:hypothetical protein
MVRAFATVKDDDGAGAGARAAVATRGAVGPTAMRIAHAGGNAFV